MALKVDRVEGGRSARVQLVLLRMTGLASSFVKFRGMQRATWLLGARFDEGNAAVIQLPAGGRLAVRLGDGYWTRLLARGYKYEADIAGEITAALRNGVDFLDLGANIGYWSVVAVHGGARKVVAVEASPDNFVQLQRNADLNGKSFTALHAAVWHQSGEELTMVSHAQRHAGNSVVDRTAKVGSPGYVESAVATVTIDDLVREHFADSPQRPLLIKLDVEGAEIQAITGAENTLAAREVILLYEDHGSDPECRVSQTLLQHGLHLFSEGGLVTLESIRAMKSDPHTGYNFVARNQTSAGSSTDSPGVVRS